MSDADPHARHGEALLAAYRDHTGPSPEATERLLAALRRDAAREDASPSDVRKDMTRGTGTSEHALEDMPGRAAAVHVLRAHPARRWVLAAGLLAAAVIAALALRPQSGQRQARDDDDNAAAFAPGATTTSTARERPAPPRGAEPGAAPIPEADTTQPSDPAPRAPTRVRREPAAPSLADEMQRMRPAQLALAAGDPRAALELLDAYARDFPDGRLHEEQLALHAIARCQLGASEGASEAAAFLRARPLSMFAERVRGACGSQ